MPKSTNYKIDFYHVCVKKNLSSIQFTFEVGSSTTLEKIDKKNTSKRTKIDQKIRRHRRLIPCKPDSNV